MFLNAVRFQEIVEELVRLKQINYLEAVLMYCQENELELEDVGSLITVDLKDKIKVDAMNEGLMKKEARLPV